MIDWDRYEVDIEYRADVEAELARMELLDA
jgi:hypothetical protein